MPQHRVLLFTDVVDSTQLTEQLGDATAADLWAEHDRVVRRLTRDAGGLEIDKSDGFLLLFDDVQAAVVCALQMHRELAGLEPPLISRAGIHRAPMLTRENNANDRALGAKPLEIDGIGKAVASRIMTLARGGQTLLSADASSALCAGDTSRSGRPWQLASHGHWRMKGLAEPIELFEVAWADAPMLPPPDSPKSYRVVRTNDRWTPRAELRHGLPGERDAFVGRGEMLSAMAARFDAADATRIVTLLGIGGIGKTRLALRYARDWLGDYPGGAWFCDLSSTHGLDGIVHAVAQALDVPLGKSEPVHQLGAAIAGRGNCLVILDNFEQVARHAEATLGAWLNRAPEARFIVTSREVLGIAGEEVLVLAPLNTDEAIQLFEKRARAADSQWIPSVEDERELLILVELLDRLPLAIELAAARIRVMSPKEMRERMGQRFQLLTSSGGRRDRQATLQATLDWSWDLLSSAEQWALAQLSVFEGGFTLDAAGAVVSFVGLDDEHWIANVLQNLLQKSLLRRANANRFDMLRAVQDYARARCMSQTPDSGSCEPSRPAAERRHWQYFAEQAEPLNVGHYDVNLDNLFAACRRAAQPDPVSAARLLVVIWSHVKWIGPFDVVLELAQSIRTSDSANSEHHRMVEETAGEANALLGNRQAAGELLASALRLAVAHDDELAQARIQCELVGLEPEEGSIDSARERLCAALTTAERLDSTPVRMRAMNAMARVLMTRSQMREAELWYERALELATARDDGRWIGGLHGNLGTLHHAQGRLESARCHYEQSLALSQVAGNRQWEGNMRCNYGLLLNELGEVQGAHTELQAALDIARSIGHLRLEATTLCNLGITLEASKQSERALSCYQQAVQTAERMSSPVIEGQLRGYFAAALARSLRHEESAHCMNCAVELCRASDDPATHALLASQAALISVLAGRVDAALAELVEAEHWLSFAEADAGAECRRVIGEVRAKLGTT